MRWRGAGGSESARSPASRELRAPAAVRPGAGDANAATAEARKRSGRESRNLEGQLAESHRLIDIRNSELSALQRKLGPRRPTAPAPVTAAACLKRKPAPFGYRGFLRPAPTAPAATPSAPHGQLPVAARRWKAPHRRCPLPAPSTVVQKRKPAVVAA